MNAKRLNIRRSIVMYYEFKAVRVSYHFVLFHGVLPQPGRCLFDARGICTRLSPAEAPQPPPCERSIQGCLSSNLGFITRFEQRQKPSLLARRHAPGNRRQPDIASRSWSIKFRSKICVEMRLNLGPRLSPPDAGSLQRPRTRR
jgi:hypothetical protein